MARKILRVSVCTLVLFIPMLFLLPSLLRGSTDLKVQVTVRVANIRLKPSLDSPVIGKATKGQVFKVIRRISDWYSIELPPDPEGMLLSGFIHQSVVMEVGEEIPRPGPSIQPKPEKKEKAPFPQKQEQEVPAPLPPRLSREEVASTPASGKKFFIRLGGEVWF